ncbi:hypothetical protein MJO29_012670 [Puccinia striiformis f. sp. tritici]|nr:hypothetical protein MJO29_012670 [Puccinia striiformis f. sp. tritici]
MYPSSQHSSEQQQHQHHPRRQTSLLCTTESISFSNTQDVRDRSTQIQRASQSETDLNLLDSNNPATGYDQWAFPSPAGGSSNIRLPASASSFQKTFNHQHHQPLYPERWPKKSRLVHSKNNSRHPCRRWSLIIVIITPLTCFAIILLIRPSAIFQSDSQERTMINSDRLSKTNPVPTDPISNTLKNVSSSPTTQDSTRPLSLNILLFSNPSLDPARSLDRIFSFLDAVPVYSLVIVCSPAPQCPRPGNLSPHRLIDSLSVYTPAMTADTILVLDAASLSHNLDRAWLTAAAELALSRSRIVAAVAASPARLPSAMACTSRPGPASVALPPFVLPTRRWPEIDPASRREFSSPLQLAFFLATHLKWPSLVLPLETQTPDYHYLSEICHDSIRQLSEMRSQELDEKGEDEEEDVDQILRGHLQASVGILITQTDIDRPGSSSNEDTDWLTLMCKLIERFDAEIYLLSSYQDGTDGSEDQEQREQEDVEESVRGWMKSCSRAADLIVHFLKPLSSDTSFTTSHSHSSPILEQIDQLMDTQSSLELLFYRLQDFDPLRLPDRFIRTFAHQQQQRRQQEDSSFDGAGEPLEDQEDLEDDQDEDEQDECVLIGLPSDEVMAADWILGLDIQALKQWHKPKVDISVITNDRSSSLSRLLDSLERAAYYGDAVNLVINMEQTADQRTRKLVEGFEWKHGSKTVRKRIIQGGLLPAVVESWYPSSAYDSYGVLLEDDVEVSGYFYGWLKFALLEYRYSGRPTGSIYGISLYQPQHSELRPEGRRPFHAPVLLAGLGVHPTTLPYASQVPCSWGALFFPETWTDFERYLTFRLADKLPGLPLNQPVIPSPIRSNRWPKSWKKYLIEWVYLRGQVMIYPNYHQLNQTSPDETLIDNLNEWGADGRLIPTGLSTNHLEVGTHVHNRDYVRPSHKLQYEQHQQGKLRFTKWGESTIGQTRVIGGEEGKEERKRKAQLAAAQLKREFAIALKPLSRDQSLLDGLSPSGSLHPRLPSVTSLTAFDLWAEPTALDIIRHRGFFAALSSGICDPFESLHRAHLDRVTKAKAASVIFPPQPSDRLEMLTAICQ